MSAGEHLGSRAVRVFRIHVDAHRAGWMKPWRAEPDDNGDIAFSVGYESMEPTPTGIRPRSYTRIPPYAYELDCSALDATHRAVVSDAAEYWRGAGWMCWLSPPMGGGYECW